MRQVALYQQAIYATARKQPDGSLLSDFPTALTLSQIIYWFTPTKKSASSRPIAKKKEVQKFYPGEDDKKILFLSCTSSWIGGYAGLTKLQVYRSIKILKRLGLIETKVGNNTKLGIRNALVVRPNFKAIVDLANSNTVNTEVETVEN